MTQITDHLAQIIERVARSAERAHRSPSSVTIVAIGKGKPAASLAEAHRAGLTQFGESYVQEALPKIAELASLPLTWHFVGKLQTNKTRQVAEAFDWVHTVDRIKIAERLNEQRKPFAPPLNVLIQVNQGGDARRAGAAPDEVAALAKSIARLPRLKLRGLMTLPPQSGTPAHWFAELAALRDQLQDGGVTLDCLSMGMSGDFDEAIAAGATHVRIGTAIFGSRD